MVNKASIAIVVFILVGIAFFMFWGESDESIIKKQFYSFAQLIAKEKGEKVIGSFSKKGKIKDMFAQTCKVSVGNNFIKGNYNADKMASEIIRGRIMFNELSVKFYDINVTVAQEEAQVVMTARAHGTSKSGGKIKEIREVQSSLKKVDGKWKIYVLEESKVLKK